MSYAIKFAIKRSDGGDYVVAPLEGLWWMSDGGSFDNERTADWRWTLMMRQPDMATRKMFEDGRQHAGTKVALATLSRLRFESYEEGTCVQVMHVGPYDQEGPTLDLLRAFLTEHGLTVRGKHHEIYLSDPRRTPPERMRAVVRIPVEPRSVTSNFS
jgi:hypothetical protein